MSNYRQIHTRMWSSDTWFSSLGPELKLLFVYLFSNERASACGLYELPLRIISFDTGLSAEQVQHGFELFSQAGKAQYDPETGVVWVRNMLKYQSSSSPKLRARIQADIKAVPDCDLKREALAYLAVALGRPSPAAQAAPVDTGSDSGRIGYDHHDDTPLSVSVPVHDSLSISVSLSEGEGVQGEGEQQPGREVLQAYERNIGAITPLAAEALLDDEQEYGAEWVCAAIQEAVRSEVRNLRYVEAILARWKRSGFKSTGPRPKGKTGKGQSMDDVHEMLEEWLREQQP